MLRYVIRRILVMIPTLIAISIIRFVIIQLPPGDFLSTHARRNAVAGRGRCSMTRSNICATLYGLDRPVWEQYVYWAWGLLHGDLGYSFEYDRPVDAGRRRPGVPDLRDLFHHHRLHLDRRLPDRHLFRDPPIQLGRPRPDASSAFSASRRPISCWRWCCSMSPMSGSASRSAVWSTPSYIDQPMSWGKFVSVLQHLWIPVIVIGTSGTAGMIRRLRANLLDELQKPYVVTGRAKGLPPPRAGQVSAAAWRSTRSSPTSATCCPS